VIRTRARIVPSRSVNVIVPRLCMVTFGAGKPSIRVRQTRCRPPSTTRAEITS
jgi:hypothetical protein